MHYMLVSVCLWKTQPRLPLHAKHGKGEVVSASEGDLRSRAEAETGGGSKEKGDHKDRLFQINSAKTRNYIPEPWIFFQLASIAFTAFSGSGT